MDILLYIMVGFCLVLSFLVMIISLSKRNQTRDVGAALMDFQSAFYKQLEHINKQNAQSASQLRQEVLGMFGVLGDNFTKTLNGTARANRDDMEKLRAAVETKLKEISDTNERRLEQMRKTVDEQLHDMLQKRLTGSFKQVSDQLEQVFKSMGEVKSLAAGVGDLKRVLSNVKIRGTWGEMQLGSLISSMLSPAQYVTNASVKDNQERVEFAIVFPGGMDSHVLLPIDSKFPMEDFIKKEDMLRTGDKNMAKDALRSLSKSLVTEAQRIQKKYVNPPVTTDFAIMYLPTEGLYADAIMLGISDVCQREYHVTIAGPSTLSALLNSLQMGFRTLAIEKQSVEVLRLLDSTKKAFSNFTVAIDKTQKSLAAAQNNLEDASRKSKTIERQLNKVDNFERNELIDDNLN